MDLLHVDLLDAVDEVRSPVQTRAGGDPVLTESQDHAFLGRIDDIETGERPSTHRDRRDHACTHQAAAGETETAPGAATAASATEQAPEPRLQLFQYLVEIGRALLVASVAPGIASAVTAGLVPRH